ADRRPSVPAHSPRRVPAIIFRAVPAGRERGGRMSRNAGKANGKKYVYSFGAGGAEGDGSRKDLLGGKGANLAEMARLGLPVPPGFTITSEVCTFFYDCKKTYPKGLEAEVAGHLASVEKALGRRFGEPANPLLV